MWLQLVVAKPHPAGPSPVRTLRPPPASRPAAATFRFSAKASSSASAAYTASTAALQTPDMAPGQCASVHAAVACTSTLPPIAATCRICFVITGWLCHVTVAEGDIPLCLHALRVNCPVAVWVQPDGLYGHVWERQVRLHAEYMSTKLLKANSNLS